MTKRKVVFLVPCNAINMAVVGFFNRENMFAEIDCSKFEFLPGRDIKKIPAQNDYGIWKNAHSYLAPLITSYEKAVILVDAQFPGSPGAKAIQEDITQNMLIAGWQKENFIVSVFEPELEALMWHTDNTVLSQIIKFHDHEVKLSQWLVDNGWVEQDQIVPQQPKEALEAALKLNRNGKNIRLSVACKKFAELSDITSCINSSFKTLVQQFQNWFPVVQA